MHALTVYVDILAGMLSSAFTMAQSVARFRPYCFSALLIAFQS